MFFSSYKNYGWELKRRHNDKNVGGFFINVRICMNTSSSRSGTVTMSKVHENNMSFVRCSVIEFALCTRDKCDVVMT